MGLEISDVDPGFDQRKQQILRSLRDGSDDRSPKGSVDAHIAHLLNRINAHRDYISTSSCSGRIAICSQAEGQSNRWILLSHDPISFDQLRSSLDDYFSSAHQSAADSLKLVFEPFILAIQCRSLLSAGRLWKAGLTSGCRESGIQTSFESGSRIIVSIRCSVRLELPLSIDHRLSVDQSYLRHLITVIDGKFTANAGKISSFTNSIESVLVDDLPPSSSANPVHYSLTTPVRHVNAVVSALRRLGPNVMDIRGGRRIQSLPAQDATIPITDQTRALLQQSPSIWESLQVPSDIPLTIVSTSSSPVSSPPSNLTPARRLRMAIESLISEYRAPTSLLDNIPDKWEILGDLALLPSSSFTDPSWSMIDQERLWNEVADAIRVNRIGRQAPIDPSRKRHSRVILYRGDNGWVRHKENGVLFELDVTKTMFSSGNGTERIRMGSISRPDETLVDLFCGIGYFSIPALVHGSVQHAHLCEWNQDTLVALQKSLDANRIAPERYRVHPGDNRLAGLSNIADRVFLGLIPTSEMSYATALQALKPSGGWLHIHSNVAANDHERFGIELNDQIQELLGTLDCRIKNGLRSRLRHIEIVKSYAPKINHIVYDLHLK